MLDTSSLSLQSVNDAQKIYWKLLISTYGDIVKTTKWLKCFNFDEGNFLHRKCHKKSWNQSCLKRRNLIDNFYAAAVKTVRAFNLTLNYLLMVSLLTKLTKQRFNQDTLHTLWRISCFNPLEDEKFQRKPFSLFFWHLNSINNNFSIFLAAEFPQGWRMTNLSFHKDRSSTSLQIFYWRMAACQFKHFIVDWTFLIHFSAYHICKVDETLEGSH